MNIGSYSDILQLVDKVEPLNRQLTKKEKKILGWSPNLLLNASGEVGYLSLL